MLCAGTKKIDGRAFYGCTALETLTLPKSVNEIGDSAFYACGSLSEVNYDASIAQFALIAIYSGNNYLKAAFYGGRVE